MSSWCLILDDALECFMFRNGFFPVRFGSLRVCILTLTKCKWMRENERRKMHSSDSMCVADTRYIPKMRALHTIFGGLENKFLVRLRGFLFFVDFWWIWGPFSIFFFIFVSSLVLLLLPDYMRMSTVINLCEWIFDSCGIIYVFRCNIWQSTYCAVIQLRADQLVK